MVRRNGGFIGTDGLDAPDPPTGVTPTAGVSSVSVAFTAPTDVGTSAITGFVAQVSIDDTAYSAGSNTGTSSPIVVSSLTVGTAATAKVWAINAYGTSAPSDASASFTPVSLQRGLFAGGSAFNDTVEQIQIATTGNATDFGNLTASSTGTGALGSSTRAIVSSAGGANSNVIDFFTFATAGNATDFGDLLAARSEQTGLANATRGVFAGEKT